MSEKKQPCSDKKESKSDTDDIKEESRSESSENGLDTEGQGSDSGSEESKTITSSNNTEPCSDKKESKSDTDDIREESQSESSENGLDTEGQGSDSGSEESETIIPSNNTEEKEETTENKKQETSNRFQIFVGIAQIIAAIATVVYVVLVWQTLIEMQTQRNNAYRPEIVITPNSFEGGMLNEDVIEPGKEYIYFDYNAPNPGECYVYSPIDNMSCAYIEKPYLTLKNIGQGTAKDVQVTFSTEWVRNAIDVLNNNSSDGYIYIAEGVNLDIGDAINVACYTSDDSDLIHLVSDTVNKEYITYIASDEDTINIELPELWQKMLAVFYDQEFRNQCLNNNSLENAVFPMKGANVIFHMPSIKISIEYSDMQGNQYVQQESIPWTGYLYYSRPESSPESEVNSIYLRTGFYESYLR